MPGITSLHGVSGEQVSLFIAAFKSWVSDLRYRCLKTDSIREPSSIQFLVSARLARLWFVVWCIVYCVDLFMSLLSSASSHSSPHLRSSLTTVGHFLSAPDSAGPTWTGAAVVCGLSYCVCCTLSVYRCVLPSGIMSCGKTVTCCIVCVTMSMCVHA